LSFYVQFLTGCAYLSLVMYTVTQFLVKRKCHRCATAFMLDRSICSDGPFDRFIGLLKIIIE
jgi:hypothetical protein